MNTNQKTAILLFLRVPQKGKVKQRLSAKLPEDVVLELYRNFILDLLDSLEKLYIPIIICFHPQEKQEELMAWLGREHNYQPQLGENFGERMRYAFTQAFDTGFV